MVKRSGRRYAYGPYTDGPDPLAPPVDVSEALDAIGKDVMAGYTPERAMREYLRRGGKDQAGLDDLARRVAERRRELSKKHNLDGTLQEIKKLLDEAVLAERKELARALDDDARFGELQLDSLSPSPAKAVQELSEYGWRSDEARQKYDQIKDLLGREMLGRALAPRGLDDLAQQELLAPYRRRTLGFGIVTQLCFFIPLGGVLVMPAAIAGATMLARDVLDATPAGVLPVPPDYRPDSV